ncbi:MAG: 6-phosphogluconolactonase [Erysipelotrichaceae bacterium]
MKITYINNFDELSKKVSDDMVEMIKHDREANICLASGDSPELAYKYFVNDLLSNNIDYHDMTITKLDEWCHVNPESPVSCECYIRERVLSPLNIKNDNYFSFLPDANDCEKEAKKIENLLHKKPISLCILGLGRNGHLGLNEPDDYLLPYAHVCELSDITKEHPMLVGHNNVHSGMSIGMQEILNSEKIILMVCGEGKQEIFDELMTMKINSHLPASFLYLHNNVELYVDLNNFSKPI